MSIASFVPFGFAGDQTFACAASKKPSASFASAEIIADVQALSHELHSPRPLLVGVVAAMRGFCREPSEQKSAEIDFR